MKNRVWWFLGFYLLLSLFIINQLVYLITIWSNTALSQLYSNGFTIDPVSPTYFNSSSTFAIFYLPLIGIFLSIGGIVTSIVSQSVVLKSTTAMRKAIFLVSSFVIFLLGFYLSFSAQLFYNEWNNSAVKIIPNSTEKAIPAIQFYKNWLSRTQLWTLFGVFFGFVIIAIILLIKLYFLNIQWSRYVLRNNEDEEAELELLSPLPNNGEFDPYATQTITISLDKQSLNEQFNHKMRTSTLNLKNKDLAKKKNNKTKKNLKKKKK